jgi:excisionase family DNA binding protein
MATENSNIELMTVDEVAEYLKVTTKTIYRMLKSGGIPSTRVGHLHRFIKSDINDWLRKGGSKGLTSEKH